VTLAMRVPAPTASRLDMKDKMTKFKRKMANLNLTSLTNLKKIQ
jgi:hypothetical protein